MRRLFLALIPLALPLAAAPARRKKPLAPAPGKIPGPASARPEAPPPADPDGGAAAWFELQLVRSGAPLKALGEPKLLFLYPNEPQPLRATFIAGDGKAARIVTLEFRLRKTAARDRFEFELLPPGGERARTLLVPGDERTALYAVWSDARGDDTVLLAARRAGPGDAAVAKAVTRRLVRVAFRIRMRIEQATAAGTKFLGTAELIAPLGGRATETIRNTSQRLVKKLLPAEPGPAAAPAPPSATVSAGTATGDAAPAALATGAPPSAPAAAPPPTVPQPAGAGASATPGKFVETEVPLEETDEFEVVAGGDTEGAKLRWAVAVSGRLAKGDGTFLPVEFTQRHIGYRHQEASVSVSAPGALYHYTLTFDPDWEDEKPIEIPK